MSLLTPEFIASYANKKTPWGFGGLGEVVYLRTYSRHIQEMNRNETWTETIVRAINGAVEIGTPLTQQVAETLFDHL